MEVWLILYLLIFFFALAIFLWIAVTLGYIKPKRLVGPPLVLVSKSYQEECTGQVDDFYHNTSGSSILVNIQTSKGFNSCADKLFMVVGQRQENLVDLGKDRTTVIPDKAVISYKCSNQPPGVPSTGGAPTVHTCDFEVKITRM